MFDPIKMFSVGKTIVDTVYDRRVSPLIHLREYMAYSMSFWGFILLFVMVALWISNVNRMNSGYFDNDVWSKEQTRIIIIPITVALVSSSLMFVSSILFLLTFIGDLF